MIAFACLLAGIVLGWIIGYCHGVDACTPKGWRSRRAQVLNLSGSLGNVRRQAYGPAGSDALSPRATGSVLAPVFSKPRAVHAFGQRQPIRKVRS